MESANDQAALRYVAIGQYCDSSAICFRGRHRKTNDEIIVGSGEMGATVDAGNRDTLRSCCPFADCRRQFVQEKETTAKRREAREPMKRKSVRQATEMRSGKRRRWANVMSRLN
jgi:hypothetical protein